MSFEIALDIGMTSYLVEDYSKFEFLGNKSTWIASEQLTLVICALTDIMLVKWARKLLQKEIDSTLARSGSLIHTSSWDGQNLD